MGSRFQDHDRGCFTKIQNTMTVHNHIKCNENNFKLTKISRARGFSESTMVNFTTKFYLHVKLYALSYESFFNYE